MIENHGLKSEVLCVSKLDCLKIINTAEKNSERSRIVVTIQSTACQTIMHAKPTGETTIAHHRSVLTAHISPPWEHSMKTAARKSVMSGRSTSESTSRLRFLANR